VAKRREGAADWRVDPSTIEWDELYASTREPEVIDPAIRDALRQAIASKRLIRFTTRENSRTLDAEPHVYGRSAGWDRVLLHPAEGRPSWGDWRVIKLADVTSLEVLDETFKRRTLPHSLDPDNPKARRSP
jgi:hypothetical protein